MNLRELMEIATEGYEAPERELGYETPILSLREFFDADGKPTNVPGDGLANFVVNELAETFDEKATDEAQLAEAERAIERAIEQLRGVIDALAVRRGV